MVCGPGGVRVELVKDIAVRVTPLTTLDATEMLRSLATFPLLEGYRGASGADVAAVEACSCASAPSPSINPPSSRSTASDRGRTRRCGRRRRPRVRPHGDART
jgi:hypothetical protein